MRWALFCALAFAVLGVAAASCAGDASFDVKYASDYARPRTVSVFGVFKDGRMDTESWDTLGERLSAPLGGGACEIAVGARLREESPSLVATLDDFTRANGVTDELLDHFGPMAKGELVLLFTIAGHPPHALGDAGARQARPSSNRFGGRRSRGGMGAPSGGSSGATDRSVFEVSASLFSVRQHESVAILGMTYDGQSVEDALRKFTARLGVELAGTRCVGWEWSARVDEEKLKTLSE